MKCNCSSMKENDNQEISIRTISGLEMNQYVSAANQSLAALSPTAAAAFAAPAAAMFAAGLDQGIETQLHITPDGEALVSSSFASGNDGSIVLRGMIGFIPYELQLQVSLDNATVVVTLQMTKPFPLGPFTWRFNLGGISTNSAGDIVGATTIALVDTDAASVAAAAGGFNWWCVLKCGGTGILPVLLLCLPSLSGGPAGFVACVVGKLGGSAAGIAACVAQKCVK